MAIRLQRCLGQAFDMSPGQYVVEPDPLDVCQAIVTICCPACKQLRELDVDHDIEVDGRVSPAFKCDGVGCPFFEHLELESWNT